VDRSKAVVGVAGAAVEADATMGYLSRFPVSVSIWSSLEVPTYSISLP
jgi:hypothetical protein